LRSLLVIGAGGLGCPALLALAPRVDALGIADDDVVDVSNLQRQILHRTADVGRPKVDSARDSLASRWPSLRVDTHRVRVTETNVDALVRQYAAVLDGSDSFATKFLLNDACLRAGVPLVHGGVVGWTGQLMTVVAGHACYRCIFEAPPPDGVAPSCQQAGIIGAVAGVVGALMADEALAILDGQPRLAGTLLVYDALAGTRRRVHARPRPSCPTCFAEAA
jgi:adenylyltransferase/sulfurtransferase